MQRLDVDLPVVGFGGAPYHLPDSPLSTVGVTERDASAAGLAVRVARTQVAEIATMPRPRIVGRWSWPLYRRRIFGTGTAAEAS